jgi:hypothetical protein
MLEFRMDSDELLRLALRRLLHGTPEKPGGAPERRREVARRAGVSPDNLYQVAAATMLPSGVPRSVGRELRLKLDEAYPNWLDELRDDLAKAEAPRPGGTAATPSVREALEVIRERLKDLDIGRAENVGEALKLMAKVPDSDRAFEQAVVLLTAIK